MRHLIIVAEMADGNVRRIRRHTVTTARGAARLRGQNHQLWMTRETAEALGARVDNLDIRLSTKINELEQAIRGRADGAAFDGLKMEVETLRSHIVAHTTVLDEDGNAHEVCEVCGKRKKPEADREDAVDKEKLIAVAIYNIICEHDENPHWKGGLKRILTDFANEVAGKEGR